MSIDFNSAEQARKALHDIVAEQKRLKSQNRSLSENIDKKAADLAKVSKRLSEIESQGGAYTGSRGDGSLDKYIKRDGSVRMCGESTEDTAFMPGLLDDAAKSDWQQDVQKAVDEYNLVRTIRRSSEAPKTKARLDELMSRAPSAAIRKAFVDASGSGGDWIPDVMLPQLERNLTMQRRVASIFETVPMADKTVIMPFLTTGFRPYKKAAMAGDDPAQFASSSMSTDSRTITANGFAVRAQVDADASEDSILAALPLIRQELVTAIVDGEEDCIINGDATSTHGDTISAWNIRGRWGASGLGGSADHRRAWTGLRHRAVDVSTHYASASEDLAGILHLRSLMDAPHGVDGDLALITSPEVYLKTMLQLEEVLTLDKWGTNYTALSGQLATLAGMPVILSEFVAADMTTGGLYTDGTGGKSGVIICNRSRFKLGVRAGAAVEIDKDITRGMYDVVATAREVFYSVDPATKKNVAYGISWDT